MPGKAGVGVLTHLLGQDPAEPRREDRRLPEGNRAPAHDGWPGHVVLMVHTYLGDDEDEVRETVRGPLCDYLRSSLGLLLGSQVDGARKVDVAELGPEDMDFMVNRSFDRYYDHGGLLGTVDKVRDTVIAFADMGVDEIACLIDFGLASATVLAGLGQLARLRDVSAAGQRAGDGR